MMLVKRVKFVALLWVAEVLASLAVWRTSLAEPVWPGTPTHRVGEPLQPLHFWKAEISRLGYWALFFSLAALLWFIAWRGLRRRVPPLAMASLGAVLAVAAEVVTSVCHWRALPPFDVRFPGWGPAFRDYLWGHLISWAVVMAAGLGLWYFRRRRLRPAKP
jgi:hypothetical protein